MVFTAPLSILPAGWIYIRHVWQTGATHCSRITWRTGSASARRSLQMIRGERERDGVWGLGVGGEREEGREEKIKCVCRL